MSDQNFRLSDGLVEAIRAGVVRREWYCGSDKAECRPGEDWGYLHFGCHWSFLLWTPDHDELETAYQRGITFEVAPET